MGFIRRIFGRDVDSVTSRDTGRVLTADAATLSGVKWASPLPIPPSAGQVIKSTGNTEGDYDWDSEYSFDLPAPASVGQVLTATGTNVGEYAWGASTAAETRVIKGLIGSTVTDSITLTRSAMRIYIVSPAGGGGGGDSDQYAQPGAFAGNSGMILDVLYTHTYNTAVAVSVTIGIPGPGGTFGSNPTDGQDGGNVTVTVDGVPIVVFGGKGGKRGGLGIYAGDPTPRGEPTINGNTVYVGELYSVGQNSFLVNSIYHTYSATPPSSTGNGMPGVSPKTRVFSEGTPIAGGYYTTPGESAPYTAIGTSGGGGASEYGGNFTGSNGGSGGPGLVILSI